MNNEPEVVVLELDICQGPIWTSDFETGEPITCVDIIDNDPILPKWNKECCHLYSSFYEFDSHDMACWFDEEGLKANRQRLIDLIEKIKARLDEINDGSFIVEDRVSKWL